MIASPGEPSRCLAAAGRAPCSWPGFPGAGARGWPAFWPRPAPPRRSMSRMVPFPTCSAPWLPLDSDRSRSSSPWRAAAGTGWCGIWAFAGGWPWARVEVARSAGRSLVRVPPSVRDGTSSPSWRPARPGSSLAGSTWSSNRLTSRFPSNGSPSGISPRWPSCGATPSTWCPVGWSWTWPTGGRSVTTRGCGGTTSTRWGSPRRGRAPRGGCAIAWDVGVLTLALKRMLQRHPDWLQVSYYELSADPLPGCQALDQLGLRWTEMQPSSSGKLVIYFVVVGAIPRLIPTPLRPPRRPVGGRSKDRSTSGA